MKSLPTILIIFSLAFFLVGCGDKTKAPEPKDIKKTEKKESKTQDSATDPAKEDIPQEDTVEEKKTNFVEPSKEEPKEEPEAVETEQPPAQKKLKVATTVKESAKPADVKKVEPPEPTP